MPNPVAVNDLQPISGSLQTSRISYGVETAGKNYGQDYNGTTWYSDIPNNGEFYTIISDNYTANYYVSRSNAEGAYVEGGLPAVDEYSAPVFWVTTGTSSLDIITIVNGLPDRIGQIPFNSGSQALNWVASSSNYFAVGPDYYEQIDADQLQLYLEGNQVISYPTTGSTWYDLSGNGKNGTLYNGPVWDSNGWFNFDGSDDYLQGPIPNQNPEEATLELIYRTTADEPFPGENRLFSIGVAGNIPGGSVTPGISLRLRDDRIAFSARKGDNSGYWDIYSGATVIDGRWRHVIGTFDTTSIKRYENGVLTAQTSTGQTYLTASDGYNIGGPVYYVDGSIAKARFYSKTLTQAEVLQNYYGGPIVTDGLVYAIDAGNLVSYPKSGTTTYALTGSNNGSLINGVGFSSADGGSWVFDGVDDYVGVGYNATLAPTSAITFEAWAWKSNWVDSVSQRILSKTQSGGYHIGMNEGGFIPTGNIGILCYYGGNYRSTYVAQSTVPSGWNHFVGTCDGRYLRFYINGVNVSTYDLGSTGTIYYAVNNSLLIGAEVGSGTGADGSYFNGKIASTRIYEKALTAAEVLQNYNATK